MQIPEIIKAIRYNYLEKVKEILKKRAGHLMARDKEGKTLLMHAVINKNLEIVDFLLEHRIDVNLQDDIGYTALHYAALENLTGVGEKLIQKGADINSKDIHGNSPLWTAVFETKGYIERAGFVKLLIQRGVDATSKNKYDLSALDLAEDWDDIRELLV